MKHASLYILEKYYLYGERQEQNMEKIIRKLRDTLKKKLKKKKKIDLKTHAWQNTFIQAFV